ncbi:transposase family Tnp2 protein, partial [Rhizoctonia solani 123E]
MCDRQNEAFATTYLTKQSVRKHRKKYGIHPEAQGAAPSLAKVATSLRSPSLGLENNLDDISMNSRNSGSESCHFDPPPIGRSSISAWSQSGSPLESDQIMVPQNDSLVLSPLSMSSGVCIPSDTGSHVSLRPCSPSSSYLHPGGSSNASSSSSSRLDSDSGSAYEYSQLQAMDANADVDFFGQKLLDLSVSGVSKLSPPPFRSWPYDHTNSDGKDDPLGGDEPDESDDPDNLGDPNDPDNPDDPDDPDDPLGAEVDEVDIHVPPDDAGDAPGDPGGDDARHIPALDEHPTLRNIYLRTWVQYAFRGVTQEAIQAMLESHKYALLAGAEFYPDEFVAEVNNMPTTLRSLERRLGLDFSDLLVTYPLCPECGKRYTMDELYALGNSQCLRHVGDRCTGNLYVETILADGTRKRTPNKSVVYNSFPEALGRLLSRIGIAYFTHHWRGNDPNNAPLENPPEPRDPQEWFNRMGPRRRFSDIAQGAGWHTQATGTSRGFNGEEYIDEPTGDAVLSLARLPIGLNLGVGADGYVLMLYSYSANGVYVVINNLPFYLRNLIENMILVLVLPGPHEPKGYAFDQMIEPFVDDLIRLANGIILPVYDSETGQIEQRLVYANLSVLIVDWISRIKCLGHVGVTAEENHCPYCKIRQCQLAAPEGYQPDGYEFRDPHEHLQEKHRWLRAPEHEREAVHVESGTMFTEFDRIPGFFGFDNAPVDTMHCLDLGVTRSIARDIIFNTGMLRKRFRGQDYEDSPEARFNAFLARTIFPHHCSRLPTSAGKMGGRTKAEQWRLLCLVMPVAYFEAWRVDDTIPDGDPRDRPHLNDCFPSRNPRHYYANVLRYCLASTLLTRHRITLDEIQQGAMFLEQVGTVFTDMNVHLTPSFHAATHLPDHICKYGSVYNTLTARFERANRLLRNVNTNGHGHGVLETTMAKGFLRRTECYRYVTELQSIEMPTADDTKTTNVLLGAMRNGPEHEVQRGMLEAVLAGEAPMQGQEEIRLATTSAQVNFRHNSYRQYYQPMVNFCNNHRPEALRNVVFFGFGEAPNRGELQVHIRPRGSTRSYPHFHRYGVRYGSANHYRGKKSRYGYIHNQVPVLIRGIYETTVEVWGQEYKFLAIMVQRFIAPDEEPAFPWNHWNNTLGIDAWKHDQLAPLEVVPPTVFTGVFVLSDLIMTYGHFWITIAMIK